jgi:hypothetical protein
MPVKTNDEGSDKDRIRKDKSVDNAGNPTAKPHDILNVVEDNSGMSAKLPKR